MFGSREVIFKVEMEWGKTSKKLVWKLQQNTQENNGESELKNRQKWKDVFEQYSRSTTTKI